MSFAYLSICTANTSSKLFTSSLAKIKIMLKYCEKGLINRKFVLAPTDKAANNVVVVRKMYYINTLKQEIETSTGNIMFISIICWMRYR